jgi:hypothetical protein
MYIRRVLIAIDQLINTIFGGDPDETISSRCGKSSGLICKAICVVLNFFDKNHCVESIEEDEGDPWEI